MCDRAAIQQVIVERTISLVLLLLLIASLSLTAGIPLQNAFRVRPFPHQRCHPGDRRLGGNQELPGREVHSPRPNESW